MLRGVGRGLLTRLVAAPVLGNAVGRGGRLREGLRPAPGRLPDRGRDREPAAQCQECGCVRGFLQFGEGKSAWGAHGGPITQMCVAVFYLLLDFVTILQVV